MAQQMAAVQLIAPIDVPHDVTIQSMSGMTSQCFLMIKAAVRLTGRTILSLIYDVSGDTPMLDKVWMMSRSTDPAAIARGDDLTLLVDCKLWAPVGTDRSSSSPPRSTADTSPCLPTARASSTGRASLPSTSPPARVERNSESRAALLGDLEPRGGTTLLLAA